MKWFRWLGIISVIAALAGCRVNTAERNDAGIGLYNQGDYSSAVNAYQAAQVAAPDQPEPYFNAASAYAETGELDKAIDALQQALKTANDNLAEQAYYNLGNVFFKMKHFPEAVQAYQQALLRDPSDDDARHNLELALKQIVAPTPTPEAQDATPTPDQGGGQPTPSPQPSAGAVTPSPVSQPDNQSLTPTLENTLSAQDAETLLDAIQRDQHTLQEYLSTPQTNPSGKDW